MIYICCITYIYIYMQDIKIQRFSAERFPQRNNGSCPKLIQQRWMTTASPHHTARLPVTWEPEVFFLGLTSGVEKRVAMGEDSGSSAGNISWLKMFMLKLFTCHIYIELMNVFCCCCCWCSWNDHEHEPRQGHICWLENSAGADTVIEVPIMRWEHETVSGPWGHWFLNLEKLKSA